MTNLLLVDEIQSIVGFDETTRIIGMSLKLYNEFQITKRPSLILPFR